MSQEERSEALIEVLEDLQESDIGYVLVGGYAVSQFETRFSTDLDLVIAPDEYDDVVAFLEGHEFERRDELEVPPDETIYNRAIELFDGPKDSFTRSASTFSSMGWGVGRRRRSGPSSTFVNTAPIKPSRAGHGRQQPEQLMVRCSSRRSSTAAGRQTSPTYWLPSRRSTSKRWRPTYTAVTKRPFAPSSRTLGSS